MFNFFYPKTIFWNAKLIIQFAIIINWFFKKMEAEPIFILEAQCCFSL
jgi:hypothetical protein